MRKFLKLFVILIVSLLMMVACGDDDTSTGNNGNEQDESTSEIGSTENDNADEDSNQEDVENDDSSSPNSESDDEVLILALGETGVIKDTLGDYEVTVTGFRFEEEMGEEDPYQTPDNGRFIVIDVSIENVGEAPLEAQEITNTDIFTESGAGITNYTSFNSINNFNSELLPGDSVEGQLLFDLSIEDYYELAFGFGMPSHISNEIRWALHAEDAE